MYVSIIIDSFSPTIFSQRKFLLIAVDGICVVTKRGKHMAFTQMFNANSLIKSALKKILDTKIRFIYFFKERTNTREIYRAECHKSYFAYSSQESSCFKDSLHFKIQFLNQSPRNRRRKELLINHHCNDCQSTIVHPRKIDTFSKVSMYIAYKVGVRIFLPSF